MSRIRDWKTLIQGLGESFVDLAVAEVETLGGDLARSGRSLGTALALAVAAVGLAFWALGVFTVTLIVALNLLMPLWGAALLVFSLLLVAFAITGQLAMRRVRSLQPPARMVRQRWQDHLDWWETVRGGMGELPDAIEPEPPTPDDRKGRFPRFGK
ncbi:MAG: phage holin family protein [Thermoanaerobaculia bacterium]|nr:phage holin family protein [Thermoanaerobaculia bacterium]